MLYNLIRGKLMYYLKALRKQGYKCKACGVDIKTMHFSFYKYNKQALVEMLKCNNSDILSSYAPNEIFFWVYDKLWENWIDCLCWKCAIKRVKKDLTTPYDIKQVEKDSKQIEEVIENLKSGLGFKTSYISQYAPSLLYPVKRSSIRESIGYDITKFPLKGVDIWNSYEFSTLTSSGKPVTMQLQIIYDADSESIVESKSLKLYLNSFNQSLPTNFLQTIQKDLKSALNAKQVDVILNPKDLSRIQKPVKSYINLDMLDTKNFYYTYNSYIPHTAIQGKPKVQRFMTKSFKSNCRFSGLPDWACAYIEFLPSKYIIKPEDLHRYLVSYRNHNEFHEECCERICYDIIQSVQPIWLRVRLFYTRRGGIDINPIRIYDPYNVYKYDRLKEIEQYKRQIFQ